MTVALPPSADNMDLKGLLDAANQASTQVALLHVAFMAASFYVLVIVSGTTDLDLLIGKGVKLPIVDVDVPIIGFYTTAPVVIVLVHFNLLLQLQLLSRKLYIFESKIMAPRNDSAGSPLLRKKAVGSELGIVHVDERDLLHIFPCTHFLVGQYDGLIRRCLSIVTALSLLILPLATLFLVQLRFLAYQSESITWFQRAAVWSDIAVIVALWPVIMDRSGRWTGFLRQVAREMRIHRFIALNALALFIAGVACLFTTRESFDDLLRFETISTIIALTVFGLSVSWVTTGAVVALRFIRERRRAFGARKQINAPMEQRGVGAFVIAVAIGCVFPLALVVKGESLEVSTIGETNFSRVNPFRTLNAKGKTLLAKPPSPEVLDSLRGSLTQRLNGLSKVDRLTLSGRNFRGANFQFAVLTGADLRGSDLKGADFSFAHIEGAQFDGAHISRANFFFSFAEAANFSVFSPGAKFEGTRLEGANFADAMIEGATFLDGALDGAIFAHAILNGASFRGAHLKGASFACAEMAGADLRHAQLFDTDFHGAQTAWIDLRETQWDAYSPGERESLAASKSEGHDEENVINRLLCPTPDKSSRRFDSCLTDKITPPQFVCFKSWHLETIEGYRKHLYEVLTKVACLDPIIPLTLLLEYTHPEPNPRLDQEFLLLLWNLQQDPKCKGVQDEQVREWILSADPTVRKRLSSSDTVNNRPSSDSGAQ